jgi:hypothetical protein
MQNEKLDWSHVIKTVREFVLSRCKTDEGTFAYIKDQMLCTDTFHDYSSMDALYDRLTDSPDPRVWDELAEAVDQMRELIVEHFKDPWNFAPGYKKPKLTVKTENISARTWEKLMKEAAPKVYEALKQKEKADTVARKQARKEAAAEISDARVEELARLYNANLMPACDRMLKSFAKHGVNSDDVWYFEMTKEQLEAFKTGAGFYAAMQAKFTDQKKLVEKMLDVISCEKAFTDARVRDVFALYHDATGRKRFVKAVYA